MKKQALYLTIAILLGTSFLAQAQEATFTPPLPLHTAEGNSGVFISSTAYMCNPPVNEGDIFGLPSFSATGVFVGEKDFQSYVVTQNILGRIEIGYAMERMGLGDWSDDVFQLTGARPQNYVVMHNLNTRLMAVQEGDFDCPWMPAITFGAHFKWNDGLDEINRTCGGVCDMLGADRDFGIDLTVVASKTITDLLPMPIIVSAGIRNSDAIHTGLAGFAGERATTFEGSIVAFLTENLAIAAEYRHKPHLMDQLAGTDLVRKENDWYDLCLAYIVNENLTISGGYANFGNVFNHYEDNVWGFQIKYEF
ncbi:MAG: DUF3034 family protein [Sedimentisphaerales bacterium]|nr:DUF3034 family protein [Sedimentisphaerales bacterium]